MVLYTILYIYIHQHVQDVAASFDSLSRSSLHVGIDQVVRRGVDAKPQTSVYAGLLASNTHPPSACCCEEVQFGMDEGEKCGSTNERLSTPSLI